MNKTVEQIEKELDENILAENVAKRSGGGSKQLSYLETWYVIDRLNKVFGNMGWDQFTEYNEPIPGTELPTYRARVRIVASVPVLDQNGQTVGFRSVTKEGTGWGSDKSKQNPHEMAAKEAESDALKRAAMKFGISMGLGLYDKSGEFVTATPSPSPSPAATPPGGGALQRTSLNAKISAMSAVVIAKKLATGAELKADMKAKYGADTKEALTDEQAKELLAYLEKRANG